MKLDATAYFQCAKDGVISVKEHTRTWYFAENICFYAGNKIQSVRYVNYVTNILAQCSLYKNAFFLFPIPKKNVIFYIHHLLF